MMDSSESKAQKFLLLSKAYIMLSHGIENSAALDESESRAPHILPEPAEHHNTTVESKKVDI